MLPCLQILGLAGLFLVLWLNLLSQDFARGSALTTVAVAVASLCLATALLLWRWTRVGGYTAHRSLGEWLRGGPAPSQVSLARRLRYLTPLADMSAITGWLYFGVALLWLVLGGIRALESVSASLGHFTVAAVWLIGGAYRIVFTRRWGHRATSLYNETLLKQAERGAAAP